MLMILAPYLACSPSSGTVRNLYAVFRYLQCWGSRWWSQGSNIWISLPVSWKEVRDLTYWNWTFTQDRLGLQKLNSTLLKDKYVLLYEWACITIFFPMKDKEKKKDSETILGQLVTSVITQRQCAAL